VVVKDYNTTAQTPEALYRLTESYLSLGILEEAKKTTSLLSYNYKKSNWYKLSYELIKKYGYKKNGKKS
jgi:outer membrane protein assembly factor BamD